MARAWMQEFAPLMSQAINEIFTVDDHVELLATCYVAVKFFASRRGGGGGKSQCNVGESFIFGQISWHAILRIS